MGLDLEQQPILLCKRCKQDLSEEEIQELKNDQMKIDIELQQAPASVNGQNQAGEYQEFKGIDLDELESQEESLQIGKIRIWAAQIVLTFTAIIGMGYTFVHQQKIADFFKETDISDKDLDDLQKRLDKNGLKNTKIFFIDLKVLERLGEFFFFAAIAGVIIANLAIFTRNKFINYRKSRKAFHILAGMTYFGALVVFFVWWSANYEILRNEYKLTLDGNSQLKDLQALSYEYIGYWGYSFKNWDKAKSTLGGYSQFNSIDAVYQICKKSDLIPIYMAALIFAVICIDCILEKIKVRQLKKQHQIKLIELKKNEEENQKIMNVDINSQGDSNQSFNNQNSNKLIQDDNTTSNQIPNNSNLQKVPSIDGDTNSINQNGQNQKHFIQPIQQYEPDEEIKAPYSGQHIKGSKQKLNTNSSGSQNKSIEEKEQQQGQNRLDDHYNDFNDILSQKSNQKKTKSENEIKEYNKQEQNQRPVSAISKTSEKLEIKSSQDIVNVSRKNFNLGSEKRLEQVGNNPSPGGNVNFDKELQKQQQEVLNTEENDHAYPII